MSLAFLVNGQDTLKLYRLASVLKVEKENVYQIVFNPSQTTYIAGENAVTLYDNIRGYSSILNYNTTLDSAGVLYAGKDTIIQFLDINLSTPTNLVDANGNSLLIEENGGLPVNIQDQTTQPLDLFFSQQDGTATTVSVTGVFNENEITVANVSSFTIGKRVLLLSTTGRVFESTIIGISVNTLTLDSPLDYAFEIGSDAIPVTNELNVDGSVTPQVFQIRGDIGTVDIPIDIDITRIIFQIITNDPPAFEEFGDIIGGLTNGIVLRRANGYVSNIFNAKTNGELANLMYDITIYLESGPPATNGIAGRMTFAGQDKHGVAIRLGTDESLDLIIQDDLTSLVSFKIMAQGHIVQE